MPVVAELVPYILQKLGVPQNEIELVLNSDLPFESFMETLAENSDIDKLLDVFAGGEPNTNHILIAKLVKAGYLKTIVTTNFDTLIEKALEQEEWIAGRDYEVVYKEEEFDAIDWNDYKIRLIKIHGSIEDKENIGVTMKKVASKQLSNQRQGVINHVFSKGKHKNVLVAGYSSSDAFDLTPHIRAIRENRKNVIYIQHDASREDMEAIAVQKEKNPFEAFGGHRVFYQFDKFGKKVWEGISEKEQYQLRAYTRQWQEDVDAWLRQMEKERTEASKYLTAGTVFLKISEFQTAQKHYVQALKIYKAIGNKRGEGNACNNLGNVYLNLGDYPQAIKYYEEALQIAKDIGDKAGEVSALIGLGTDYYALGNYSRAIKYYEQVLQIAKDIGNKAGKKSALIGLGNAYSALGNYSRAIKYYEQALEIVSAIGDKGGEGTALIGLGNAYSALGNYSRAIKYYEQVLQIAKDIGNKAGEGSTLIGLGNAYYTLGNYSRAIKYYEEALQIAKDIGDKAGEGKSIAGLGNAYNRPGEYEKAIGYYEQALEIAVTLGSKQEEGNAHIGLGAAYRSLGDYPQAIEYHARTLKIYRAILPEGHSYIKLAEGNLELAKRELDEQKKINGVKA